jgi:hypothetical protein
MSGVVVFAALARCAEGLLLCQDVDTSRWPFVDAAECAARLPALIEEAQRSSEPGRLVMGRCRYALKPTFSRPVDPWAVRRTAEHDGSAQ